MDGCVLRSCGWLRRPHKIIMVAIKLCQWHRQTRDNGCRWTSFRIKPLELNVLQVDFIAQAPWNVTEFHLNVLETGFHFLMLVLAVS